MPSKKRNINQPDTENASTATFYAPAYGALTQAMNRSVSSGEVNFQGMVYTLIESGKSYELGKNYIFASFNPLAEHLLVDQNDVGILGAAAFYAKHLRLYRHPRHIVLEKLHILERLLDCVFINRSLPDVLLLSQLQSTISPSEAILTLKTSEGAGNPLSSLPLPLDFWIRQRMGVCRHVNLLAFILLGQAVQAGHFPAGKVYAIRSLLARSNTGHLTVGYQEEASQKFWLIDTLNTAYFDLSSTAGIKAAMTHYVEDPGVTDKQDWVNFILDILARYKIPTNVEEVSQNLPDACTLFDLFEKAGPMKKTYLEWFLDQMETTGATPTFKIMIRGCLALPCKNQPLYQAFSQDLDRAGMRPQ